MRFVLDSSVTLAFVLADEATPETDAILDSLGKGEKAIIPAVWRWEVANALFQAERRKRVTTTDVNRHLTSLRALPIDIDENAAAETWNASLLLARKHELTVYDASYLELAIRFGAPLASLDGPLRKAAKAEGVKLLPSTV